MVKFCMGLVRLDCAPSDLPPHDFSRETAVEEPCFYPSSFPARFWVHVLQASQRKSERERAETEPRSVFLLQKGSQPAELGSRLLTEGSDPGHGCRSADGWKLSGVWREGGQVEALGWVGGSSK